MDRCFSTFSKFSHVPQCENSVIKCTGKRSRTTELYDKNPEIRPMKSRKMNESNYKANEFTNK